MGGDEFTVILTKIVEPEDAAIVARRIVDSLTKPFLLEGHPVSIGVSIGIGIYPLDGEDPDTLLKKADTAMYRAKSAGSNLFRYYSTERLTVLILYGKIRRQGHEPPLLVIFFPDIFPFLFVFHGFHCYRWLTVVVDIQNNRCLPFFRGTLHLLDPEVGNRNTLCCNLLSA